jgi:hypothetical protein
MDCEERKHLEERAEAKRMAEYSGSGIEPTVSDDIS